MSRYLRVNIDVCIHARVPWDVTHRCELRVNLGIHERAVERILSYQGDACTRSREVDVRVLVGEHDECRKWAEDTMVERKGGVFFSGGLPSISQFSHDQLSLGEGSVASAA